MINPFNMNEWKICKYLHFGSANVFDSKNCEYTQHQRQSQSVCNRNEFWLCRRNLSLTKNDGDSKIYTYNLHKMDPTVCQTDTDMHETHLMPSGTIPSFLFIYDRLIYSHETNGEMKIASFLSNWIGFEYTKEWNFTNVNTCKRDRWLIEWGGKNGASTRWKFVWQHQTASSLGLEILMLTMVTVHRMVKLFE